MAKPKFLSLDGVQTLVQYFKDRLSEKVDIESGKTLSDNNFSDEEKTKLAGIEADSQVNLIESISVNGNNQSITNKNVDIAVPLVDNTLTQAGQSADAKATGDAISELIQSTANDVANLQQSISSTATTIRGEIADEVATINQTISDVENAIPTNVSELTNDSNYATTSQLTTQITNVRNDIPTNVSELVNDSDYTTKLYVDSEIASVEGDIPINISQLNNDSNYTTKSYVDGEIDEIEAVIPTNVSQLTNDVKYQTENEVARSIANSVSQITSFDYQILNELPQTGKKGTIYLVLHTHGGEDKFDEYIWVNNRYEKLGNTDIDLSGYAHTTDLPTKVSDLNNDSNFTTKTYVDGKLDTKQDVIDYGTPTENDVGKALMPKVISNGEVTEWEFGESGSIDDVQVNGASIVSDGVANIPIAGIDTAGVVKVGGLGVKISNNELVISPASSGQIKRGTGDNSPIVSSKEHESAFYGLAKAAGDTTQSQSSNSVGTYTLEAKTAIQTMLGLNNKLESPSTAGTSGQVLTSDGNGGQTWEDPSGGVTDVQINSISILDANGVAKIPVASASTFGAVKTYSSYGTKIETGGYVAIQRANNEIKAGTDGYRPITPYRQHASTFYGLAKAAGDTTQSQSQNAVGTYTDEAKLSIQSMLGVPASDIIAPQFDTSLNYSAGDYVYSEGKLYRFTADHANGALDGSDTVEVTVTGDMVNDVTVNGTSVVVDGVAEIPIASASSLGVIQVPAAGGLNVVNNNLYTNGADTGIIKNPNLFAGSAYRPVVPIRQHESTFYGLAKAAGDTTQSSSANAVGTYTDEAKTAIKSMLGVEAGDLSIGTVTTLPSTSSATAEITGDFEDMELNLAIPRGDTGVYVGSTPPQDSDISVWIDTSESINPYVETIAGNEVTITGEPNYRYVCGEVYSISITPPSAGTIEVMFTSGSTAAVLTLPNTVHMPEWWVGVEANYTYDICIIDGTYAGVVMWPT